MCLQHRGSLSRENSRAEHGAQECAKVLGGALAPGSDAWHWGAGQAHTVVQQLKPGGELWDTIRKSLSDQARHALHVTTLPMAPTCA